MVAGAIASVTGFGIGSLLTPTLGLLGGLVGTQGGIRSAASLGAELPRQTFVAAATAVGLIVDAARVPIYLATTGAEALAIRIERTTC